MSETLAGDGFRLRRATADDVDFVLELASHDDVDPYLRAVRPGREDLLREIEQSLAEPRGLRPLRDRGRGAGQSGAARA